MPGTHIDSEPPGLSEGLPNSGLTAGDCLAGQQAAPIPRAPRIRPSTIMASVTMIPGTLGTLHYCKYRRALLLNLLAAMHYWLLEKAG